MTISEDSMKTGSKNILVEIENSICTITLNRTKSLNVFNEQMLTDLAEVIDRICVDENVKVVVLLSACENAFTAGADIKEMSTKDVDESRLFAQMGQGIARKLETMPQPVIVGINGYALGGGVELACACDIRIATESSTFSQPEIDIGVIPGWGGTQRLSRIIGIAKAKELIYTGKRIDASEAESIGLVNHVVQDDKLNESVTTLALTMAGKGKVALFNAKRSINMLYETFLEHGLRFELERWSELFDTHDQKEGMKAFLEGRQPEFKDK